MQAVAVAQVGVPPWLQTPPLVIGIVLIVVSVIVGSVPSWVGIAGALLVLAGIATMAMVPRRLLARTNRSVHVFELPRSQRAAIEAPRASLELAELPSLSGGSVRLAGERLWANYGSGIERDAMAEVLAPDVALCATRPPGRRTDRPPAGAVSLGWGERELGIPK